MTQPSREAGSHDLPHWALFLGCFSSQASAGAPLRLLCSTFRLGYC